MPSTHTLTQSVQMKTDGPAMSSTASFCVLPQNEQRGTWVGSSEEFDLLDTSELLSHVTPKSCPLSNGKGPVRARLTARALVLGAVVAATSVACAGSGLSKEQARQYVAASLSDQSELDAAAFTGSFCESDEGRRERIQGGGAVPSNAYAVGRMADDPLLNKLIAAGYVERKEEALTPGVAESIHPACKRDLCLECASISKYYVATYQLTPKGTELFLSAPVTEDEYMRLYNTGQNNGPFDDVQQEFGDDMPMRIFVVVATKTFDVTRTAVDMGNRTARVDYEWSWKPSPRIEKTVLRQMIPTGRSRASVQLKQLEDGWHLARDAEPMRQ
jgi:hypothetical protein